MNQKIKILGLTLGEPFSHTSRSGVNYNIFSRLKNDKNCELIDVFDLDLSGVYKLYAAINNFSFNRAKWGSKLHQNPWSFDVRSRKAESIINNLGKEFDIIYQDGAMFMPGYQNNIPFVSYHDSNVILSSRGGNTAHGAHYKGKILKQTIEQEKELYTNASIVFTMSDWLKKSLIEDFGISENKIKTVYAGTNLSINEFKKEYDGRTILFIGRDFKRKGGKILLDAFKYVKKEQPDARLLIIGSDINVEQDGVDVKGPINDKDILEKYFKSASVFVMPSLFEPFGIVFAEAFTYKTPCIGTNTCAMPEIIEDGKGGFLVPPNNTKILADKILTLLQNEKLSREMGEYGYNKVKRYYDWDVVVDKMITEIVKMMNK